MTPIAISSDRARIAVGRLVASAGALSAPNRPGNVEVIPEKIIIGWQTSLLECFTEVS